MTQQNNVSLVIYSRFGAPQPSCLLGVVNLSHDLKHCWVYTSCQNIFKGGKCGRQGGDVCNGDGSELCLSMGNKAGGKVILAPLYLQSEAWALHPLPLFFFLGSNMCWELFIRGHKQGKMKLK